MSLPARKEAFKELDMARWTQSSKLSRVARLQRSCSCQPHHL